MLIGRSLLLLSVLIARSPFGGCQESMPFELKDNLIKIPVQVDGQVMNAVLDSGTGSIGLDTRDAVAQGVPLGAQIGLIPGGGKPEPFYLIKLPRLDFGPEHMEAVPAIALELGSLSSSAGFHVQLLLGRPVFEDRAIQISYRDRTLTFFPVGSEPVCSDPLPLTLSGGVPIVTVRLKSASTSNPVQLNLIVDLGTRHFAAMIGGQFLDTAEGKQLQSSGRPLQVGTGTGGVVMGTATSAADLSIGRKHFPGLTIALTREVGAFGKDGIDGSIGVPLWESGSIIFDYPHKKFCLESSK
jgi:hypothetical protein